MSNGKPDDLVREIEQTRTRLAGTVDQLIDRANPKNVAKRSIGNAKGKFVTADGQPKMEAIMPVVLGVVGFIGVIVVIRRIVR